jgi:putative membrane protein
VGAVSANTIGSHDTGAFVSNAGQGDMLEIEEAKLVQTRSKNAEVKAFAKMMASDHAAMSKAMGPLITAAGKTPPTELDQRRKGFVDNLRAAKDADFDKVYIDQQVDAHKEALDLMQGYGDNGPDAGLKAAASKATAKVQAHLDHARAIQAKLSASK